MNSAIRAALINPHPLSGHLMRCSLFHSTPFLERKRRTHWESRSNQYSRRFRKLQAKRTLLRNFNAYADFVFQSWQNEAHEEDPFLGNGASWFKQYWTRGHGRGRSRRQGPQHHSRRVFEFCEDEDDVEKIFESAFGGNRFFYWSFVQDENPHWWSSSSSYSSSYFRRRHQRYSSDEEYESSSDSENFELESRSASDRLALGLSASGPLKLEEVKNAYRVCALKWHPDRHLGSSKAIAEEKFKLCSAAYHSLCDKLAVN